MKELLPKLTERLAHYRDRAIRIEVPRFLNAIPNEDNDKITHTWFWPCVGNFFKPKDVIVTETGMFVCRTTSICTNLQHRKGTANFGLLDVPLPEKSTLINQVLWGSIGWATGECWLCISVSMTYKVYTL
jgi:pyruvate decarboxylase